jgi:hypothetical protein
MRRKSPKVSGFVRKYSRFAETIGGDVFNHDCRPTEAVLFELIKASKLDGRRINQRMTRLSSVVMAKKQPSRLGARQP